MKYLAKMVTEYWRQCSIDYKNLENLQVRIKNDWINEFVSEIEFNRGTKSEK